jgi:transcriptional regulator of acetoin/glycerol metabolism
MLFGHVRGAFTGATNDRKGWFELANHGTLFLDEIGDMPMSLQGKLLRVLEDGEILSVGSAKPVKVDVRVIAASNADLPAKILDGSFRQGFRRRLLRPPMRTMSKARATLKVRAKPEPRTGMSLKRRPSGSGSTISRYWSAIFCNSSPTRWA